ncbi:uncharacterized protein K02A2.6-like [Drosophila obscura]|uniref:uncharacterized protein K02A2.6-like n=1 Tax=Drosophila obscura TaxID=7282 RepID=UPI001BB10D6E|nr:uncharacterized protein K02A2.6-like [Drosophila obscura]
MQHRYEQTRKRIMGDEVEEIARTGSARTQRARVRFQARQRRRRGICAAIRSALSQDDRPFTQVSLGSMKLMGLLDTGASVSLLGRGGKELIDELELKLQESTKSSVQTAGGTPHQILGHVTALMTYGGQKHTMELFLCPSLKQPLYLGVDFWQKFGLAPQIVSREQGEEVAEIEAELLTRSRPMEPHELTHSQQTRLDQVKEKFRSFDAHGLGRTKIENHEIRLVEGAVPVKERFYPVSPAVQELLFAEVDEMLRLGVIELSESPWSNWVMLSIESILSRVEDTVFISSIDLKHAFWQMAARKSNVYSIYAQQLCRLMDRVIPQRVRSHVFVYLDDLLVISRTFEEHMKLLEEVAKCLNEANLTIGKKKSSVMRATWGLEQDSSTSMNYSVPEKECLAAVKAIEKFRAYVELMPFTVITDHASLQWLMKFKALDGRLARWSLALQAYDFEIEHPKGKDNVVADMLSRPFDVEAIDFLDFDTTAFEAEEYQGRIETVQQDRDNFPDLKVEDGLLFRRTQFARPELEEFQWKLWIPEALTNTLIQEAHDSDVAMHGGIARTLGRLRQYYYWPRMTVQVKAYVTGCETCRETKHSTQIKRPLMGAETVTERPIQKLYLDFLGPYPRTRSGNVVILIVLDHMTKYVWLKAMSKATSAVVIRFLREEVFPQFGVPETVHTDNGKQFVSAEFTQFLNKRSITHMRSGNYAPQANAAERVNQTVQAAIRTYVGDDHTRWDEKLTEIQCAARSAIHTGIGTSPYFVLFGQHMFTSGRDYKLARRLGALNDAQVSLVARQDQQEIIRDEVRKNSHEAYKRAKKRQETTTAQEGGDDCSGHGRPQAGKPRDEDCGPHGSAHRQTAA